MSLAQDGRRFLWHLLENMWSPVATLCLHFSRYSCPSHQTWNSNCMNAFLAMFNWCTQPFYWSISYFVNFCPCQQVVQASVVVKVEHSRFGDLGSIPADNYKTFVHNWLGAWVEKVAWHHETLLLVTSDYPGSPLVATYQNAQFLLTKFSRCARSYMADQKWSHRK